jgi:hypothetical protein
VNEDLQAQRIQRLAEAVSRRNAKLAEGEDEKQKLERVRNLRHLGLGKPRGPKLPTTPGGRVLTKGEAATPGTVMKRETRSERRRRKNRARDYRQPKSPKNQAKAFNRQKR